MRERGRVSGSLLRRGVLSVWVVCSLIGADATLAHHSFAMFDNDHQIKLTGSVSSFDWNNPHVYIQLAATDARGRPKTYTVECASPGILDRVGWKFNMIKAGDRITVIIAPLKTGEPGGLLKQVTLADGRSFSNGAPAGKAKIK